MGKEGLALEDGKIKEWYAVKERGTYEYWGEINRETIQLEKEKEGNMKLSEENQKRRENSSMMIRLQVARLKRPVPNLFPVRHNNTQLPNP